MTEKRFKFSGYCEVYDTTDTYNTIDCATSLDAEIVYNLLNKLSGENEQLKKKIERITKDKEIWAFISDCSVQVMNEEENFKKDYLRIATNDLKNLQEENEELKQENQRLNQTLERIQKELNRYNNEWVDL